MIFSLHSENRIPCFVLYFDILLHHHSVTNNKGGCMWDRHACHQHCQIFISQQQIQATSTQSRRQIILDSHRLKFITLQPPRSSSQPLWAKLECGLSRTFLLMVAKEGALPTTSETQFEHASTFSLGKFILHCKSCLFFQVRFTVYYFPRYIRQATPQNEWKLCMPSTHAP